MYLQKNRPPKLSLILCNRIFLPRATGRSDEMRAFFIITLCILFKDKIADECE